VLDRLTKSGTSIAHPSTYVSPMLTNMFDDFLRETSRSANMSPTLAANSSGFLVKV